MRNPKQAFIFVLFVMALTPITLMAESSSAPSKSAASKSSLNTQIFEKESSVETFQDQVKLVRDMAGESQVIFKSHPGFFILEDNGSGAKFKNQLLKATKSKHSLSISFEKESRIIKDVSEKE